MSKFDSKNLQKLYKELLALQNKYKFRLGILITEKGFVLACPDEVTAINNLMKAVSSIYCEGISQGKVNIDHLPQVFNDIRDQIMSFSKEVVKEAQETK